MAAVLQTADEFLAAGLFTAEEKDSWLLQPLAPGRNSSPRKSQSLWVLHATGVAGGSSLFRHVRHD
jgi:hypothetical protein